MIDAANAATGAVLWVGVETVDGVPATYLPWAAGSPGLTDGAAVVMRLLNPEAGRFVATERTQTTGFITYCECAP